MLQKSTSCGRLPLSTLKYIAILLFLLAGSDSSYAVITINNPGYLRVFNNTIFNDDVVIKAGTFVDFRGTIKVATSKTITVEPGAILRINNATVTHPTDNFSNTTTGFWGGIILLGNNTAQDGDVKRMCHFNLHYCMSQNNMRYLLQDGCLGSLFSPFANGALYINNSNIRYANNGVSVRSGGLLYATSSKFENNITSIRLQSVPTTFVQKSLIQSNQFITDFRSSYTNAIEFIEISENRNVYYDIRNNNFNHVITSGSNPNIETYRGISTHYSAVNIRANTFQNLLCAINCHAYALTAKSKTIENNNMYNCYVGIWNGSADLNRIYRNNIYPANFNNTRGQFIYSTSSSMPGKLTANAPVGILNDGYNSIAAEQNNILKSNLAYKNEIGILNMSPGYTGTGTFYSSYHGYYKNKISQMYINFQSQTHPVPSQQMISKAQLTCNIFEGIYYSGPWGSLFGKTYRDMYITPSHSLQAQGTSSSSAGNIFSNLSYTGFQHIYNTGLNFNYYYPQNPSLTTGVTKISATANSCPNPIIYYEQAKYFCGPTIIQFTPTNGLTVGKTAVLQELDAQKLALQAIEVNGVSAAEKDEYDHITTQYDVNLVKLVAIYDDEIAADTVDPDDNYDSIAAYLQTHISYAGRYYSIALALDREHYDLAEQLADDLCDIYPYEAGIIQLKNYVYLLTDYFREPEATKISWLSDHFTTIKNMGDDPDNFAAPKARVWAQYIADNDDQNIYHGQTIYPTYILVDSTYQEEPPQQSNVNVTVFPNPFIENLTVSVQNLSESAMTFTVELYNMNNGLLHSQLLPVGSGATGNAVIPGSGLQTGYYIVKVSYNGQTVYSGLVYKQ